MQTCESDLHIQEARDRNVGIVNMYFKPWEFFKDSVRGSVRTGEGVDRAGGPHPNV